MRAIILAAGRGERMRPLTDTTPKPLLQVQGKPLIVRHIEALARAGVRDIVINCAWLAGQFPQALGDGSVFGVRLHYSVEADALETAGGMVQALPLLTADGDDCFWAISGDLFVPDFVFDPCQARAFAAGTLQAHLWMVPKSEMHPVGDFGIGADGLALDEAGLAPAAREVFGNIGLYRASLLAGIAPGQRQRLGVCLREAIGRQQIGAELYRGRWVNVGTPQQLEALNASAS